MIAKYSEHLKKCITKYQDKNPAIAVCFCLAATDLAKKLNLREFDDLHETCSQLYAKFADPVPPSSQRVFSVSRMVIDMLNQIILKQPDLYHIVFHQAINTEGYVNLYTMSLVPGSVIQKAHALASACSFENGIALLPRQYEQESRMLQMSYIPLAYKTLAVNTYLAATTLYVSVDRSKVIQSLTGSSYALLADLINPATQMIAASKQVPAESPDHLVIRLEYDGVALQLISSQEYANFTHLLHPLYVKSVDVQIM